MMNTIGVVFLTVLAVQCGTGESLRGLGMFSSSLIPVLNWDVGSFSAELSATGCYFDHDAEEYRMQ